MKNQTLKTQANLIRKTIVEMVYHANASHVGSALSIVDLLTCLYFKVNTSLLKDEQIFNRDSVVLSKGHACTALYATLFHTGVLSQKEILTYGKNESTSRCCSFGNAIFENYCNFFSPISNF